MIPGTCIAVKMRKDIFARGTLKDDDRPLDDQTGAFAVLLDGEANLRCVTPITLHSIHSCSVCHMRDGVAGVKVLWCRMCPLGYCCNTGRPNTCYLAEYGQLAEWHRNELNAIRFCCDICVKADGCLSHDTFVCRGDMVDNVTAHSHESDSSSDGDYSNGDDKQEEQVDENKEIDRRRDVLFHK